MIGRAGRQRGPKPGAMTVSIAIAMFNGARFLTEQLDSIASQTCLPDELVITDDCSRDDSVATAEGFAERAPFPVRLIRHPRNIGILENFYSAFGASQGDVIFYCDQDDVWRPDKIATLVAPLRANAMLAMHQSEIVGEALDPHHRTAPGNARYGSFAFPADTGTIHGYGHQMAFRRVVLDMMQRLRPTIEAIAPNGFAHDLDRYIPFCASLLGEIVVLPDPLVKFRRHASATSPAGAAPAATSSRATTGWGGKAGYLIDRDAEGAALRLAIVEAAGASGLLPSAAAATLLRAFAGRARIARRQRAVLDASGFAARLRAVAPVIAALPAQGFTNERRLRAAALALLAAVAPTKREVSRTDSAIPARSTGG